MLYGLVALCKMVVILLFMLSDIVVYVRVRR